MAQTPPPGIDPVPTPEIQRGDRATFSDRVDAFISWLVLAVTQFAALAANVYANAVDAFNNATSAAQDAETALNAAQSASDSASIAAVSATGLTATSTSSLAIGTGSKAFTVPIGKSFVPGIRVTAVNPSNPAQYMSGTVASYSGTTLTVTVDIVGGSGTVATWNISVTGQRGADGAMGPAGGVAGGSLTGALNERQGNEVALTSTPDIWSAGGNMFRLTGSGDVLGYTDAPQIGAKREYLVTGNPRLVDSANHIVSGGTQTLSPGDIVDVRAETFVNRFRVTVRRKSGLAPVSPAQTLALLGTATITTPVANIDFLNIFAADYDFYKIVLYNVSRDASADNLMLRLAKAGAVDAGTFYVASASTTSSINLGNLSNSLSRSASGEISIVATAAALQAILPSVLFMVNGGTSVNHFAEGRAYINGPSSGFRLYWSLGANFTGGTVRVYGIRNVAGVV